MPKWTKEQQDAIEKDGTNIIVSAGAGSGKTAVLTERVIEKLRKGIHLNELLILTFTKAAASEMKDRIRRKISKSEDLLDELKYLDSSYITTFDSFSLSVLKKYHYVLNMKKNINITDEIVIKITKNKIFNEVFDSYYEKDNENFFKLIDKFCLKNDIVFRKNLFSISEKIEGFINRDEYLDYIKNNFYTEDGFTKFKNEFLNLVKEQKEVVLLEIDNVGLYFDDKFMQGVWDSINPILNSESYDDFCLFTKASLPRVPANTEDEAKQAKEKLKKSIDGLLKLNKYKSIENLKNDFYENSDAIKTICEILSEYFEKLDNYKLENNMFTFQDIAKYSIKLIKENDIVRDELKYSFKEIMIDEYQDTNDIQETFISLIANNNVYMVGDIKQSIYRFRGSNPSIFMDKYEKYSKNENGLKIDLIKNFRSRSEVLESINRLFGFVMDLDIGGAAYKESHEMIFGNQKYLEEKEDYNYNLDILEYSNDKESKFTDSEIEIFTIANDIKNKKQSGYKVFDKETEKLRDVNYSDFVIILDRSKYFDDFKKIFEYLDIPLTILKDGNLNADVDLLLIKNIVELIIKIHNKEFDTSFKYDFMSIGRSFLYEYDDNYLFDVITNNKYKETQLYNDFYSIDNYNSKTSLELFNDILNITDYYNKLYKVGDYENKNVRMESISNIAKSLGELSLSFEDFNNYLQSIIDNDYKIDYTMFSDNKDSVKILTIHKSKGLEYPVCYFADLDHGFNKQDLKSKFIASEKYGIITSLLDKEDDDNFIKDLYKYNFNKEEISEKIRLFYVALTRAREKMIVVVPEKDGINLEKDENGVIKKVRRLSFDNLGSIIYSTKKYLKEYYKKVDFSEIGLTKDYLYSKKQDELDYSYNEDDFVVENINIENEKLDSKTFSKSLPQLITKEEKENMLYGIKFHEAFEYFDMKKENYDNIDDKFIKDKIIKFRNNELFKNINNSNVYHEYEFIYQDNDEEYHGIIDLMIEYDDYVDIIDFKLKNVVDDAYKKQLEGYRKYVELKSNKKVNTYLYSIIDENVIKM